MTLHIIGSGPAGLAAAAAGVAAGAEVCLIDDNPAPGGQIWRGGPAGWADARAGALWDTLRRAPNFTHVRNAQVAAAIDGGTLLLETADGADCVPVERLVLCTGARERFLPFPGWTLPGVTGAGGLQALIKGGMPVQGRRIVIAGSGPLLLATAATAVAAGAQIQAIVEHRPAGALARFGIGLALRHRRKLAEALRLFARLRGIPYLAGGRIAEAHGTDSVRSVVIRRGRTHKAFACDFLAAGFGLTANTDLGRALGCAIVDDALLVDARQKTSVASVWAAGECTGIGGVDKALIEGRVAALDALGLTPSAHDLAALRRGRDFAGLVARHFALQPALKDMCRPDTIVCRCEDVTAGELAHRADWRQAKLATRIGMGPCQGKTCAGACRFLFGWAPPAPHIPIVPVRAGSLARIE